MFTNVVVNDKGDNDESPNENFDKEFISIGTNIQIKLTAYCKLQVVSNLVSLLPNKFMRMHMYLESLT